MKTVKKILSIVIPGAFLMALVFSCSNGPSKEEKKANEAVADTINKVINLSPEAKTALYQFPTPFEVTQLLIKAKAGFIFDITNPPANVTKYSTENAKALNLGIYSADMAYSATFNRNDETGKFLSCTNKLADELGIAGVYDQTLMDKIKKFNNNKDSLINLVTKIFSSTNTFLSKNNRNQVAVLIAAGTFVESLYISTQLNVVAKDNTKISTIIAGQKDNLDKLLTVLEAYKDEKHVMKIYESVIKLKPIFTDYGLEANKKLPHDKAGQIGDLAESVRLSFIQ
jgi:hypothetical protein